jgi:hypothetical protein
MYRRLRGLLGTTLTWGVLGAIVGFPVYLSLALMGPWPVNAIRWERELTKLAAWEGMSFLWGLACGLAFAVVLLLVERRQRKQLAPTRVAAWGALAGGLFPAAVTFGALFGGGDPFYFGGIVAASSLTGAIWARMSVAIARRAPTLRIGETELLAERAL